MRDETEITQSFQPGTPPPAEPPSPVPPPVPPPGRPPRALAADVWPWLGLLALLAVAGLLVWLFVLRDRSAGAKTVPAVVGLQQQVALGRLTGAGYQVHAVVGPADRPRGIVVSQRPGGGARLDAGGTVTLSISNGRRLTVTTAPATTTAAATTTTAATTLAVPSVEGQDLVSAAGQVEAAGFVADTQPVGDAGQPGAVIAQQPAAGAQAPPGTTVVLQVAAGGNQPAKQVPDVLGEKAAAARAALLEAGFTVHTAYRKSPAKYAGVVVAQKPAGGASLSGYTQVTITVGG